MRYAIMLAAVLFAHGMRAAESFFTITGVNDSTVYDWNLASIWSGSTVPNSPDAVVSLGEPEAKRLLLRIPTSYSFAIDSIVSSPIDTYWRFNVGASTANAVSRITARTLEGYCSVWPIGFMYSQNWKLNGVMTGFDFTGTVEDPSIVPSYYLGTLPHFSVPAEDGAAEIRRLYHQGTLLKTGAGRLTVGGSAGMGAAAFVEGGSLFIDAEAEIRDDVPAPGAFLHLDASLASSILKHEADGRTYVTNWSDASGSGRCAYNVSLTRKNETVGRPYIAAETVNSRPLVDFGPYRAYGSGAGTGNPAGALFWSEANSGVREVFMAVRLNGAGSSSVAPLGNTGTCSLLMSGVETSLFVQETMTKADIRVDGEAHLARDDVSAPTAMRVVSASLPVGVPLDSVGMVASSGYGGFQLGETLVYTNVLSESERRQTIAYLKNRWLGDGAGSAERHEWDVGDVVLDGEGVSVGVPAGRTARVRRVIDFKAVAGGNSGVRKTGDGTLAIDRVVPSSTPVAVEGGKVRFTAKVADADATLPDSPEVNFDASDDASFTYAEEGSVAVTRWRDVRSGSKYVATNAVHSAGVTECPDRVASATPTGLPAVDFKDRDITQNNDHPHNPRLSFEPAPVYEGFIVWKSQYNKYFKPAHFCSSEVNVFSKRITQGQLLEYNNSDAIGKTAGMLWRIDGVSVNPLGNALGDMKGCGPVADCVWHVISFSSPVAIPLDAMAEAIDGECGGGCLVAQLVGYSRKLSDRERRGAEAYLMSKWLGKTHPDNEAFTSPISFAAGVENEIDTDADYAPSSVAFSSDSLVKSGSGSLDLGTAGASLSSVSVEGGSLSVCAVADLCSDAEFHFDASKTDTLEMAANGDGTWGVTRWHDVRKNGKYADAETVRCKSLPRWTDASADGLVPGMGYVDFGPVSATNYYAEKEESAAMNWNVAASRVMELHLVYADNETSGNEIGHPVAYGSDAGSQCGFIRAYGKSLLYQGYANMMCDTALDGAVVSQNVLKPDGFNVVSFVVTNHYSTLTAGRLNSFCNERTLTFGGVRLAEVVVFSEVQSDERRKAIDAMLLKKWRGLGDGAPPLEIALPSVSVAAGASLQMDIGDDGAACIPSIAAEIGGHGVAGAVEIDGMLDVSSPCRVEVLVSTSARLEGRSFRIVAAQALYDPSELSRWTLTLTSARPCSATLVAKDDGIYVKFIERGMRMIVK